MLSLIESGLESLRQPVASVGCVTMLLFYWCEKVSVYIRFNMLSLFNLKNLEN